jgi:hypothetical protein
MRKRGNVWLRQRKKQGGSKIEAVQAATDLPERISALALLQMVYRGEVKARAAINESGH